MTSLSEVKSALIYLYTCNDMLSQVQRRDVALPCDAIVINAFDSFYLLLWCIMFSVTHALVFIEAKGMPQGSQQATVHIRCFLYYHLLSYRRRMAVCSRAQYSHSSWDRIHTSMCVLTNKMQALRYIALSGKMRTVNMKEYEGWLNLNSWKWIFTYFNPNNKSQQFFLSLRRPVMHTVVSLKPPGRERDNPSCSHQRTEIIS